jgi:hypothetical protein
MQIVVHQIFSVIITPVSRIQWTKTMKIYNAILDFYVSNPHSNKPVAKNVIRGLQYYFVFRETDIFN